MNPPNFPKQEWAIPNKWVRVDNAFYGHDGEKWVYYGRDDQPTCDSLCFRNNCFTTFFRGNREECMQFMLDFVLSENSQKVTNLMNRFSHSRHWSTPTYEWNGIHPIIALRILQGFRVKTYKCYNPVYGMIMQKVQSVENWKNTFLKKFDPETQRLILTNPVLLDYLQGMVDFVNANPFIFQKNVEKLIIKLQLTFYMRCFFQTNALFYYFPYK